MGKKQFIALADTIMKHNEWFDHKFSPMQLDNLADFCKEQNPRFDRQKWLDYIAGKCGPNGGAIKK